MSDSAEVRTIQYDGKQFDLTPEGAAFIDAVMAAGLDEAAAFAAYKAAAGSGAIKATHKPKERIPDLAELAQPVVNRAMKRNKRLIGDVGKYFDAQDALDFLTTEAGIGDGWEWGTQLRSEKVRIGKDLNGDSGVLDLTATLEKDSDIANAAKAVLDAHRLASAGVQAVIAGVAKKKEIAEPPTVRVLFEDRETVTLSQKAAKRRSGGGGGGSNGPRAKYENEIVGDTLKVSMSIGDNDYGVIAEGDTPEAVLKAMKEKFDAIGKPWHKWTMTKKVSGWFEEK